MPKEAGAGPRERHQRDDVLQVEDQIRWGMVASAVRRFTDLEAEHSRLKQMFAERSLENQALKDVIINNL